MRDLDLDSVNVVVSDVDERMRYFTEIGTPIIEYYSIDLESMMGSIRDFISSSSKDRLNINELHYYFLQLTNLLYFVTTNVEKVGVKSIFV